jgi:colicin import membrane protein
MTTDQRQMTEAENPETGFGEENSDRLGPVTRQEVWEVVRLLQQEGAAITRRAVRKRLGRGSFSTIHLAMRELEESQRPELPPIDLGDEDKRLVDDLGAQIVQAVRERFTRITEDREAALTTAVDLANQRAEDAEKFADSEIAEAMRREGTATVAREHAQNEAQAARAATKAAMEEAQRLAGQMAVLTADRLAANEKLAACEERLTAAIAAREAEAEARARAEAQIARLQSQAEAARSETEGLRLELQRGTIELATKSALLADVSAQLSQAVKERDKAASDIIIVQVELAAVKSRAEIAEGFVAARDQQITALQAALSGETTRAERAERSLEEALGQSAMLQSIKAALDTAAARAQAAEALAAAAIRKESEAPDAEPPSP